MRKKDIYIQDSISSCGASCIRSVVSYYGGYVPLETVLEDTLTDKSGTNAYHIVRALTKYGFTAYGLNIRLESIETNRLPVIAHIKKDGYEHFVVIYEIKDKSVLTMDPEFGKKEYEIEHFKKIYDEKSIYIVPNGKVIEVKKSLSLYKLLFTSILKRKSRIFLFAMISFFAILISLISSFHLKLLEIVDEPFKFTLLLIFLKLLIIMLLYLKTILKNDILKRLDEDSIKKVLTHIFRLPVRYIKNKRVGEIVKKIEEMSKVKKIIVELLLICPLDIILFLISFIIMLSISTNLTLVYLSVIILYILLTLLTKKKIFTLTKHNTENYEEYTGELVEYIGGLESIKNIGREKLFLDNLGLSLEKHLHASIKTNRVETLIHLIKDNILEIGSLIVTYLGFISLNKIFTLIDLMTLIGLFSLLYSSLENIIDITVDLFKSKVISRNISEFLDVEEERKESSFAGEFESLEIRNLTFSYDHFKNVLDNIDLTIKKGDKLFLNGPSGVGKSTLVKCISGIIDNYEGKISINGIDTRKFSISSLKDIIIYIGQEETLFRKTIKENIVLGDYDEKHFREIIKLTKVDEIIEHRVERENTVLLEGASNISGGEKARIILARALYKKPRLLLIDETLSSISESLEDEILKNLMDIEELSVIYITHRDKKTHFEKVITL